MDMDTTVRGIDMDEENIEKIVKEIFDIDTGDGIIFRFEKIEPIREDDDYNNFRVYFVAEYGKIKNKKNGPVGQHQTTSGARGS